MKRFKFNKVAAVIAAVCMQASVLHAVPADPSPRRVAQADGTHITVRLCGDEYYHYYVTSDGYPLLADSNGVFRYAVKSGGELVPSGIKANDPDARSAAEKAFLQQYDKKSAGEAFARKHAEMRKQTPLRRALNTGYPTTGTQRALAILVDYPKIGDAGTAVPFTTPNPRQTFSDMLNKEGFDVDGATGSVHDYYYDNSGGKFNLTFDVYGPVTLDNDITFYGNNINDAWQMALEACQKLDAEIDFTNYDRDGDGVIDNVYIFYAGQGEADGGPAYTVWPHAGDIEVLSPGNTYMFDGVQLNHYACSNEIRIITDPDTQTTQTLLEGIGPVCHEFTHVMGFPDLYNTIDQSASFTPGPWSLMDVGAYNNNSHTPPYFTAFERYSLGWLEPTLITGAEDIVLNDISQNKAYRIDTPNADEYFILENRQQKGWDEYLPGHGLLVWHITYVAEKWNRNQVNTEDLYQCVDIEEADGIWSENTRAGDAFPGTANVTEITDDTYPGMRTLYEKNPTGMPITAIEERNGIMHFKVKGGRPVLDPVEVLPAEDVTPLSFVARWKEHAEATGYKLDVYQTDGSSFDYVPGFEARAVSGTECTVTGLKPETTYYYKVRATKGDDESAMSEAVEVTTGEATFEYTAPVATAATDVTSSSFTANWQLMDGADSYLLNLCTKAKGEPDVVTVDFTGGVKQMPTGWSTNCSMVVGTAGYYGNALPSLSMPTDYSYIESAVLPDNVRGLSFWYRERNNPSGDNYVAISGLVGNKWVAVDTLRLTTPASAGTVVSWSDADEDSKIPADCKAVRLTYRLIGTGALVVDDIAVSYGDNLYSVPVAEWQGRAAGSGTSLAVTGLQPSTTYYYTVNGVGGSIVTIPSDEVAVTTLSGETSIGNAPEAQPLRASLTADGWLKVTCADGGSLRISVYDVRGRLVGSASSAGGECAFRLPSAGVYIVKAGGSTLKVVFGGR